VYVVLFCVTVCATYQHVWYKGFWWWCKGWCFWWVWGICRRWCLGSWGWCSSSRSGPTESCLLIRSTKHKTNSKVLPAGAIGRRRAVADASVRRLGVNGTRLGGGAVRSRVSWGDLRVVGDDVFVLGHAAAVQTRLAIAARRTFGRRSVRYAVARVGVEAEKLSANTVVLLQIRSQSTQLSKRHFYDTFILLI